MKEDEKIINQSNINKPEIMQKIDKLYAKNELGKLMALYIKGSISEGNAVSEEVFDYLLKMNFISREYLQGLCSFIEDMATLDWIILVDTISKTKESENIVNFIKEIYHAFKSSVDIKMVKEWATLADSPYILHVMIDEYIGLNVIKKEYDNVIISIDSILGKVQEKEEAIQDITSTLQQKEETIQDITNKLQQKEKEKNELEEQLTESEKRKGYYQHSYEETCKKFDAIRDEKDKLEIKLLAAKNNQNIDNQDYEEQTKPSDETQSYRIEEQHKELLLKIESINEAILCMSDTTNQLLMKGFDDVVNHIRKQLQEQFSNNNRFTSEQFINKFTDKEEKKVNEPIEDNTELTQNTTEKEYFSPSPFDEEEQLIEEGQFMNEVDVREDDFYGVPPEYMESIENEADIGQEVEQENIDNQENVIQESLITQPYNENDLPDDIEVTTEKDRLQTGVQSHEINNAKNMEENITFFLKFKQKMNNQKKLKRFNKVEDNTKKRQMILEEAMSNHLNNEIIQGLKQLSDTETVSLEFIYMMACNKNISIEDIAKLGEYVTA